MADLTEFLFPAPAPRRAVGILRWWEARRLPYNLIVGVSGIMSLGIVRVILSLPPAAHRFDVPWQGVAVFAVLANLCYGLGAAAEVTFEKLFGKRLLPTGPTLFRMGLTFSIGLTFLPTLIAGIDWLWRMVRWLM